MSAAAALGALADMREQADRCRALWLCVVHRVLLDCARPDGHGVAARAWLRAPDEAVLDFAGLAPAALAHLRQAMRSAHEAGPGNA